MPAPLWTLPFRSMASWLLCAQMWHEAGIENRFRTERMSHSLLRPEFSSARLEAISISWLTSRRSRWQLMPTTSQVETCLAFVEWLARRNKDNAATKNYVISGMFLFGHLFFAIGRTTSSFPLFNMILAPITCMSSFPYSSLPHTLGILGFLMILKHTQNG